MKLLLTYVSSLNGKITKGDNPNVVRWSSKEDQEHFKKVLSDYDVVIRSSTTYKLAKKSLDLSGKKRYVVITRDPSKYSKEERKGILEFTSESPEELIKRLDSEGVEKALLATGGALTKLFFEQKLITDFHLTIEPKIFGNGIPLVAEGDFYVNFELEDIERLNDGGTLLVKYKIL